jgi:hypothetical protein
MHDCRRPKPRQIVSSGAKRSASLVVPIPVKAESDCDAANNEWFEDSRPRRTRSAGVLCMLSHSCTTDSIQSRLTITPPACPPMPSATPSKSLPSSLLNSPHASGFFRVRPTSLNEKVISRSVSRSPPNGAPLIALRAGQSPSGLNDLGEQTTSRNVPRDRRR